MSRILILGGGGMLGHKAYQILSREHDVHVTFRQFDKRLLATKIFDPHRVIEDVSASDMESIGKAIERTRPEIVLNCIGIIKQLDETTNPRIAIQVNALFPHLLAEECVRRKIKMIHISTDCVFSGTRGNYKEDDQSDAHDLYGRTKFLGEVTGEYCLTLRTSIIGHELFSHLSLVEWFLSQNGKTVRGYRNAIYTGFPTVTFCRELSRLIATYTQLTGLYNIAAPRISKFELLQKIKEMYDLQLEIEPFDDFYCDRSLDGNKYTVETGFQPPSWQEMIKEMYIDFNIKSARKVL
jgi:dTDP-4-dehydrorhamnose reductase